MISPENLDLVKQLLTVCANKNRYQAVLGLLSAAALVSRVTVDDVFVDEFLRPIFERTGTGLYLNTDDKYETAELAEQGR